MNVKSSLFSFPCQGLVSLTLIYKVSLRNCKTYIWSTVSTDSLNGPVFFKEQINSEAYKFVEPILQPFGFPFPRWMSMHEYKLFMGVSGMHVKQYREFPASAITRMSSICNVFRLINSTSNLNLSRIKPDRKRVWVFHLTLQPHLQKVFIVFFIWQYIMRQHFSKTYMSKPQRNYWPHNLQKHVTEICYYDFSKSL